MSSIYKMQKKGSKYYNINNFSKIKGINYKENKSLNNTYNINPENEKTINNYDNLKCLSEENQNIYNSNDYFTLNNKETLDKTLNKDRYTINSAHNLKYQINNKNFGNYFPNNFGNLNLNKNLNLRKIQNKNIEYKITQIKSELASINSDNLMMKEDIYKYTDMNKYIENEITIQKEHNETLLNKNQNLIQENEALSLQLEQDEQELNTLIQENEEKHKIFDDNQIGLEIKNEKVDKDLDELITINSNKAARCSESTLFLEQPRVMMFKVGLFILFF